MYFIDRQRVIYCGVPSSSTLRFYTYKMRDRRKDSRRQERGCSTFLEYSVQPGLSSLSSQMPGILPAFGLSISFLFFREVEEFTVTAAPPGFQRINYSCRSQTEHQQHSQAHKPTINSLLCHWFEWHVHSKSLEN